jgi:hypothetical protein
MNPQGMTLAAAVAESASGGSDKGNCTVTPSQVQEVKGYRLSNLDH